jgi:3-phosphoshikimate 1-carboxyvinyltransferase
LNAPTRLQARRGSGLRGRTRAPSDKSISHRALILGALARGDTDIEGLLESDDVLATARAVRSFGAEVTQAGPGRWRVTGHGEFRQPEGVIDCGNSGTAARLLMGAMAGFPVEATFDGDSSLRRRPMDRVLKPLAAMGVQVRCPEQRLPATLYGGFLRGLAYEPPQASAQVKSAVLLAGLNASTPTLVLEHKRTRDHTERMLAAFGADIDVEHSDEAWIIRLQPGRRLRGTEVRVPGDASSAAFPIAAALIAPDSEVTVEGVLLNPLRTGFLETLREMGANIEISGEREEGGEPVGDVTARTSKLQGVKVPAARAASMIDEYPVLAAVAAFAEGSTVMCGIEELRVKESDRIALMARGLAACGVEVEEEMDGLTVHGEGAAPHGDADVHAHGDHRIAMAHLVLGLGAENPVTVDSADMIGTSFPGFVELMRRLGADVREA